MIVKLEFESPFITGGKRLSSNFIESEDVIKGNVVRAALVKEILDQCKELENSREYNKEWDKKKNWVYYRNGQGCIKCKYSNVCKKFSDVNFSYFYPIDTEVIPLSSMVCKKNSTHGFIDILINNPSDGCKECGKNSRYEFTNGLRKVDGNFKKPYSVGMSINTKSAINPYTKTSYEGKLFSIMAVSSTHKENGLNKIIYEGNVEGLSIEELNLFKELRVGAYLSVGYGKCTMQAIDKSKKKIEIDKVIYFSNKYKEKINKYKELDNNNYIAIKFNGDCKVNFEFDGSTYIETDELKKIWEKALDIPDYFKVEKVYAELFNYRGYDNSLVTKDKREQASTMIQKGSVIVFSSQKNIKDMFMYFSDKRSFGLEQENGFGAFEIYIGR